MKNHLATIAFDDIAPSQGPLVGGKCFNLGKLRQRLSKSGLRVPNGFAITTNSWKVFLDGNPKLEDGIHKELLAIDFKKAATVRAQSKKIRAMVIAAKMPAELGEEITKAYKILEKEYWPSLDVAVRSSAVEEDMEGTSFAGQYDTFLNVRTPKNVIHMTQECFASLFNERALWYRREKKFPLFAAKGIAVGVQKMVRSDLAASGIGFSQEPVSLASYLISIDSSWGLAEPIVQGSVTPDRFLVQKPLEKGGKLLLIGKTLGAKEKKLVYAKGAGRMTVEMTPSPAMRASFSLTDAEALEVARDILAISEDYGKPMDVEWAKDGEPGGKNTDGKIYVVQARPATYERDPLLTKHCRVQGKSEVISRGLIASPGNGAAKGTAKMILSADTKEVFETGSVLVAPMTDPDWLPLMKRSAAIVTDRGGKNCHAAIVARELGIPCIVATGNATKTVKNGAQVTVDCDSGEEGLVMKGLLPIKEEVVDLRKVIQQKKGLKTKIMTIMADPSAAQQFSHYPNDGIGLARMEFVLNRGVQFHPLLAIHPKKVNELSAAQKKTLKELTDGYPSLQDYFISKVKDGVAQLAASVYPNPVIVRFSDFRSNEYSGLIGGTMFEPHEENPMIGYRGASRYYSELYKEAFKLECEAIKAARKMGYTNIKVMIPFCRTPLEAQKVTDIIHGCGLATKTEGCEIYCMVEIPSNVILLDDFAPYFDGFSIGSNDLTQLTLGLDRDSELIAHVGDERNEAVKALIAMAISKARKLGKPIGLCGQAPSNYPDYAEFLVSNGITSLSVSPDAIPNTVPIVAKAEGNSSFPKGGGQ